MATAFQSLSGVFSVFVKTFFLCFLQGGGDALFADRADPGSGYFQRHIFVLFGNVEFLFLKVGVEAPLGPVVRMGNVIPHHHFLTGYLTYICHDYLFFRLSFSKRSAKNGIIF